MKKLKSGLILAFLFMGLIANSSANNEWSNVSTEGQIQGSLITIEKAEWAELNRWGGRLERGRSYDVTDIVSDICKNNSYLDCGIRPTTELFGDPAHKAIKGLFVKGKCKHNLKFHVIGRIEGLQMLLYCFI